MKHQRPKFRATLLSASIAVLMGVSAGAVAAPQTHSVTHVFSIKDLIGDFEGTTVGTAGNGSDPSILCGTTWLGSPECPVDGPQPVPGVEAWMLFPIDSEFGFKVIPYAYATQKERGDGAWEEGWVGNIRVDDQVIGIELSDAETDTFVVPDGLGTWCAGIGGTSVKCETEHFTVMEHVLTCHETIPYYYANPLDANDQLVIKDADDNVLVDCADAKLDNNLRIVNAVSEYPGGDAATIDGKLVGTVAYDPVTGIPIDAVDWAGDASWADPDNPLTFLEPNEASVLDDIAFGGSYSMTAKDDGKALFRWGNLIKRPNDIRLYARFWTPAAWRQGGWSQNDKLGYKVTKAYLIVNHKITNNPNDQLRPEDMENEGAQGRKPGYDIVDTYGPDSWISDDLCYQGNGIEIPMGTVLKNTGITIQDTDPATHVWENDPYGWSADLRQGYTNAWYTSVDREPFEWSYDTTGEGSSDYSVRGPDLATGGELLSGPRWRMTPGKFGQDLPGLDIPNVNCAPPPYQKDLIKYPVGDYAMEELPPGVDGSKVVNVGPTIINLLDWAPTDDRGIPDPENPGQYISPLSYSNGWISGWFNDGTVLNPSVPLENTSLEGVTVNGSPVSKGFDLTVYVKGDRKPTALYNARLEVVWDDGL